MRRSMGIVNRIKKSSIAAVLGLLLAFGVQTKTDAHDALRIAVATDWHYLAPELTDHGDYFEQVISEADGKVMAYMEELSEAFVAQIMEESPDVLVLTGDLTFNGARESHEALAKKLAKIEQAGIDVYVLPGNHDLHNRMAARLTGETFALVDSVTGEQFREIYHDFGYDKAQIDPVSGSYEVQLSDQVSLLMLDTYSADNTGNLDERQLSWIEERLQEDQAAGRRVLSASHQTLMEHNKLFVYGYVMGEHEKLERLYEEYGVMANLCGHMHLQHILFGQTHIPDIVTSALSVSPNQYGMLTLDEKKASYQTKRVEVSSWAKKQGKQDENLLHFTAYAYDYFWSRAYQSAYEMIETTGLIEDKTHIEKLAAFMATVNKAYFAGRLDEVQWDDALCEELKSISGLYNAYLTGLMRERTQDQTKVEFTYAQ